MMDSSPDYSRSEVDRPDRRSGRAQAVLIAGLLAAVWAGYLAFESMFVELAKLDETFIRGTLQYDANLVCRDYRVFLGVMSIGLIAGGVGVHLWERASPPARVVVYQVAWTTLCAALVFRMLSFGAYEGPWYPIETIVYHPGDEPIFGHRVLFALPTRAVAALTGVNAKQALGIVQTAIAWFAIASVGLFCRQFGGPLFVGMGQGAFTLLIVGTIDYFNLYDIGIAMFFALGLTAALAKRWWVFGTIVGVATFNHENALLLIPTAVSAMWGLESGRRLALAGTGALGAHILARLTMAVLIPMDNVFDFRFWTNPHLIAHPTGILVHSVTLLVPCFLVAALGFPGAPSPLRRMVILFPMLLVVTFLFGKVNEPRLFNALMPIAAALIACGAASLQSGHSEAVRS